MSISAVNVRCILGGREIISEVNFEADKGQFVSIIGPNGSGKTTLLRALAASLKPVCGCVLVDGHNLACMKIKDVARKIAYVAQSMEIGFDFNVTDYVLIGRQPHLRLFQSEGSDDMAAARRAMEITGTWRLREKNVNEISGGERQRVVIARALTQETPVMLLDEPISQLDVHHQVELMDALRNMATEKGVTIVAVLHDLNMASRYSDRIILVSNGRIVMQGSPEEVLVNDTISRVYGISLKVISDPETGRPFVIPSANRKGVEK